MTPQARLKTTIEILERIEKAKVPMDATCGDFFRGRKYIGAKDRSNIAERVYGIMRAHARLGWWLKKRGHDSSPRAMIIAWLVLEEKGDPQRLFNGEKYSPEPLGEEEAALASSLHGKSLNDPDMPEEVASECPGHYLPMLKEYFGNDFASELKAMIGSAPLDLRVNLRLADREKASRFLEADGVGTSPTPYSPWGLRCEAKAFLSRTKAFSKGWIEIQDEGSQMIALCVDVKPGMQVLDYCAGAGGKTLALAAAMENKGRIVAMDTEEHRLQKGRLRFRKANVADIIEIRPLSDERHRKWLRRQKGTFDAVLADVPCTGTGTWRRNPDMRWRTYGPSLEELTAIQADILDRVAHTVRPGGRLVYATCSLLPDENERQVASFIERNPDYEIMPLAQAWPDGLRVPCDGDYMRLTPLRHNTDGFFAAVLRRKST